MTKQQIELIQNKIGTNPDGFWGPKSMAACEKYIHGVMPSVSPWPKTDQGSLTDFYGRAGDESRLGRRDVSGLGVRYEGKEVSSILCHEKVGDSLVRILQKLSKTNPEILAQYAGIYNNRPMRGGSTPSLHARGAAIDLDPDNNGNLRHWPTTATMPFDVIIEFAKEGWTSAGVFWSRDAMHFQATQP